MKKYFFVVLFFLQSNYSSKGLINFEKLVQNKGESDLNAHNIALEKNKKLYKEALIKAYIWHTIAMGSLLGLYLVYAANDNPNFTLTRTKQCAYVLGAFSIPMLTSYCDVTYVGLFKFKKVIPVVNKAFFEDIIKALVSGEKAYFTVDKAYNFEDIFTKLQDKKNIQLLINDDSIKYFQKNHSQSLSLIDFVHDTFQEILQKTMTQEQQNKIQKILDVFNFEKSIIKDIESRDNKLLFMFKILDMIENRHMFFIEQYSNEWKEQLNKINQMADEWATGWIKEQFKFSNETENILYENFKNENLNLQDDKIDNTVKNMAIVKHIIKKIICDKEYFEKIGLAYYYDKNFSKCMFEIITLMNINRNEAERKKDLIKFLIMPFLPNNSDFNHKECIFNVLLCDENFINSFYNNLYNIIVSLEGQQSIAVNKVTLKSFLDAVK